MCPLSASFLGWIWCILSNRSALMRYFWSGSSPQEGESYKAIKGSDTQLWPDPLRKTPSLQHQKYLFLLWCEPRNKQNVTIVSLWDKQSVISLSEYIHSIWDLTLSTEPFSFKCWSSLKSVLSALRTCHAIVISGAICLMSSVQH